MFKYISIFSLLSLLSLFNTPHTKAQHTFQGVVMDANTGEPVEMATVQLLHGSNQKLINYTFTDANGIFNLKTQQVDSLYITVSLLGYKTQKQTVVSDNKLLFKLEQEMFNLREVEIRPGRVWGQRDTINYDISQFLSAKDESIKDVIKKLPGVDVDELGRISYNGKNISKFYVEGMDLTDGRYNQITNNLDAKAVETVQLLENHQPIRILQDKIKTENIAMNLKLKPEFRDKWILTLQGGLGASPLLWDAWGNAMQLSRKSQSAYVYKGNNRGNDVTDENIVLFNNNAGRISEPEIPSFLSQPSIIAPLKKERLLFNDIHSFSANRLYRLNETTQFRINAGYTHDVRKQERGSETFYYQKDDTVHIAEQSNGRIRSDQGELSLYLENNADNRFLTNKLKASGDWSCSMYDFTGNSITRQRIKTPDMGIRNDFRNLWSHNDYSYEVRSSLRYNHQPGELFINNKSQPINLNHFYMDNSFSVLFKKGHLTQQYSGGITGQASNIRNGFGIYALPSWQWNKSKWRSSFSLPVVWTDFPGADFSRIAVNPSLYISYKLNYAWRFTLSGNYKEQYGDITDFRVSPYQTDYRHTILNKGILQMKRLQSYSMYSEYKNTINEFFATFSISHSRTWSNLIYEQLFEDNQVILVSRKLSNKAETWSLRGTLSKGFYDLGMKTSLDFRLSRSKAEQLSKGERMPYESNYMQFEPKVSWAPSKRFETSYEANIRCGRSKVGEETRLTPLWNVVQKLQLTYNLFPIEINVSGDHYYNDVSNNKSVNVFFADISLRWKHNGWQLMASATNLFDKKQYSYTEYSSTQRYTSWINIRGREYFISARYNF